MRYLALTPRPEQGRTWLHAGSCSAQIFNVRISALAALYTPSCRSYHGEEPALAQTRGVQSTSGYLSASCRNAFAIVLAIITQRIVGREFDVGAGAHGYTTMDSGISVVPCVERHRGTAVACVAGVPVRA